MLLRIHKFLPLTRAEGPGQRACVWVQGCPIHCRACAVPLTWSQAGGDEITVEELAHHILNGPSIEGVTFVGGEPFAQAQPLAALGQLLKTAGLSIVTFSGYTMDAIKRSKRKGWQDLLAVSDLLIDGPYVQALTDLSRPWVGSSNQRYHFLTPRYQHLEASLARIPNRVEVRLGRDGRVMVNGLIRMEDLKGLLGDLTRFEAD